MFHSHSYTRTQAVMYDFAMSFLQTDSVHVLEIYAASEPPIDGVSGEVLAQRARDFGHRCVEFAGTLERAVDNVHDNVRPGDVVMTLGAGNVWQAGELLLTKLRLESG